jgi:hypothetical protein
VSSFVCLLFLIYHNLLWYRGIPFFLRVFDEVENDDGCHWYDDDEGCGYDDEEKYCIGKIVNRELLLRKKKGRRGECSFATRRTWGNKTYLLLLRSLLPERGEGERRLRSTPGDSRREELRRSSTGERERESPRISRLIPAGERDPERERERERSMR